jgi:hypothetical protein
MAGHAIAAGTTPGAEWWRLIKAVWLKWAGGWCRGDRRRVAFKTFFHLSAFFNIVYEMTRFETRHAGDSALPLLPDEDGTIKRCLQDFRWTSPEMQLSITHERKMQDSYGKFW